MPRRTREGDTLVYSTDAAPVRASTAAAVKQSAGLRTAGHVNVARVWGIPQFWLLWAVLCLNVSAGIGVVGMASPMLQEVFGGRLLGGRRPGEIDE